MMVWQRHARAVVALIGIGTAAGVYLTFGERRHASRRLEGAQLPPQVTVESTNAELERVAGIDPKYRVRADRLTTYDDGSTRGVGVTIEAPNRDGRHFVVSARESYVAKGNSDIELTESIDLREDDGFGLKTDKATFNQGTGIARAAGEVAFGKGRMTGSGTGVTYDEHADVLHVTDRARVDLTAQGSAAAVTFRGQSATLDRVSHLLTVAGNVLVTHGEQQIDASMATAHLSDTDDRILFVELRDGARVAGGLGSVASMNGREMDLDYAEDGQTIRHAVLRTQSQITMTASGGAMGRRLEGERLEIALRPDQSLENVTGSGGVTMNIPGADGSPSRIVRGGTLDAKAGADGSLTSARFVENVSFEEDAAEGSKRTARSGVLDLAMTGSGVSGATFTERVTFSDGDLQATSREAQYEPAAGRLRLRRGDDRGAAPRVWDTRVDVEAESIDIELDARGITAKGRVRSTLTAASGSGAARKGTEGDTHLPGLLQQNKPATITADALKYDGEKGAAEYSGHTWLSQDETDVQAEWLDLQQKRGDLTARGAVRSTIVIDGDVSRGEASELQYEDARRTITYKSRQSGKAGDSQPPAHVNGPQGDLRARTIWLVLAKAESKLETLEAEDDVVSRIDTRTVRGGRLTYRTSDQLYVVTKGSSAQVVLEEVRDGKCSEATGLTLTFARSTDSMSIDGQRRSLTLWQQKASCQ